MCGILFTQNTKVTNKQFRSALMKMAFRGPDANGIAQHLGAWLGHTRLKIQDLDDQSNQPFYSDCSRYVIVFNGEIYNFKELKQKFNLLTRTSSDTEVLLKLYQLLGPDMLRQLNGMFALVIYDVQQCSIFAARDRLGIKPLFYSENASGLTFSSEPSAILALGQASDVWDEIGVRQYKKLRTFFNGHTIYRDISNFPAGHYWLDGKFVEYWSLPESEQAPPSDEELRYLVESSVDYRCIADVPVGSFLSGGLDSTIIAGLAKKVHSFSAGLPNDNEFDWSKLAAAHHNSALTCIEVDPNDFLPLWKFMIRHRAEPLSVPNEVLIYAMSKILKEKITVVLSGEGADELMFGYDRIFNWANQGVWSVQEFDKRYSYGSHEDDDIIDYVMQPFQKYKSNCDRIAAFFQIAHLHGLLRRLDFATMLCGVEARVPFVDHRLVERMAGVSFQYRMAGQQVKAPLKRVFKDVIPQQIIDRKKVGFPVQLQDVMDIGSTESPMDRWLADNLKLM
ncbi:asparagine synthase (glutamine-hydrolyzing) [uncultured Paraglaciecola sp.]|uniref:asparagine synthase (glutamine-hydrolyzing) n=1 Tax=uncultured Paraglaciecola sp. TaxID=1765024 RepID=UPI0025EBB134|nr:asparagine synthase (glutamine-hydrolyzing) [uncultured Paraglaciecola sp.]